MLSDEIKLTIQSAYSAFLKTKQLSPRYGQRIMIAEIAKALSAITQDAEGKRTSQDHVCVVEAGTGTGKTVAYLLSVIPMAQALGKKVVISTATVALQDQIINKDIPDLILNSPLRFSYQIAKGRGRYICFAQLDRLLSAGGEGDPNMALWEELGAVTVDKKTAELYQQMAIALDRGDWSGDRDHWSHEIGDHDWRRITTDHNRCSGRNCTFYEDCHFYSARNDLHRAEVVVANHDLVLADLALGGGVVLPPPEQTIYVFDEGHHLPEKALNHFSSTTQLRGTQTWLSEMEKLTAALKSAFPSAVSLSHNVERIEGLIPELKAELSMMLSTLSPLANESGNEINDSGRLVHRFEQGIVPESLKLQSEELRGLSASLHKYLNEIVDGLNDGLEGKHPDIPKPEAETWYPLVGAFYARADHVSSLWQQFSAKDIEGGAPHARWLVFSETNQGLDVELSASPIIATDVLKQYLWNRCYAAVVTSATLMALGTFERYKMLSGVPKDTIFNCVPSPFQYEEVARLEVPEMDFDPSDNYRHTQFVVEYLIHRTMNEAVLVLFTSRRQLEEVLNLLPFDLRERVLAQGELSKAEIIKTHKERVDDERSSIIFGLASFAEGIDLPGSYCEHVVIAKLPFSVPEEPIDATLAEWIKQKGGNPFMEISVPDAAIRLKQAVGRLIRTESDTGLITILDRRLVKRHYGKAILKSLPPFPFLSR